MSDTEIRELPAKPEAVYFFGTCLVDLLYPESGLAAVELLEQHRIEVIYPQAQTCCGQPAFNSGFRKEALRVARSQIALFPKSLPVIVPSGSCAAMMHVHYPHLFAGEADEAQALAFAQRVVEWSDFVARVLKPELEDRGQPVRVALHASCHLLRELGTAQAPVSLLAGLKNVELVELADASECCGFGGTFAVKHAGISTAMVQDKCAALRASGAEVLVSGDCGCLMNIAGSLNKDNPEAPLRVVPLAGFLKERCHGA